MSDYGSFECLNCGRSQERSDPKRKFCPTTPGGPSCKDRYWSRGTRRVSKMNIKLNTLTDLVEEMIGIVKSNQSRIITLERELREVKNLQLLLHQNDM